MIIYKKFLTLFIALFALFLLAIIIINYYVDPANQFFSAKSFDEKMANAALDNKVIIVRTNYNERLFKKLLLSKIKTPPDVLILGSSHVMAIDHNLFRTTKFFNAYVTNPAPILQDEIALYYLIHERGWKPKTVLIGLDYWILARNNGKEGWKALLPEYLAGKRLLFNKAETSNLYYEKLHACLEKYTQLLSYEYLIASLSKIKDLYSLRKSDGSKDHDFLIAQNSDYACRECNVLYPDGSKTPTRELEERTAAEADFEGRKVFKHSVHDNSFTELDSEYMNLFEGFIKYLVNQNIKVILYLPPIEPAAYDKVQHDSNYKMINVAERYFISIGEKYHLKILGSYNPETLGLRAVNFYDDSHLKKSAINKIFNDAFNLV